MKVQTLDLLEIKENPELLDREFKTTGFAVIKNHNLEAAVLNEVYIDWKYFFKLSTEEKMRYKHADHSGYFPFKSENAKDSDVKDLKEFFHVYASTDLPWNVIRESEFGEYAYTYFLMCSLNELATDLLESLDKTRNWRQSLVDMTKNSPQTLLRVLHYPPLSLDEDPRAIRAAAHEDINLITLLPAATSSGLEIQDMNGNWHSVDCEPGTIICNVGDMFQELTAGYYRSTTHRVVNPIGENISRYSLPYFVHAKPDTVLSSRYTAQQYLDERLKEIMKGK